MNKKAKGTRIKLKVKKWLESQGWTIANAEVSKVCYFGGRLVVVKSDLWNSDLIGINGQDIAFIQVKSNKVDVSAGIKGFAKYPFPRSVKKMVVLWEDRARIPIIKMAD